VPLNRYAVEAEGVVYRYGARTAIEPSTFAIRAGAITALIGPNGSGKSTILSGIAGLLRPASGRLVVRPVDSGPPRVAYVLQTTKVNDSLPVTVREVVTMGRYATAGGYRRLRALDRAAVAEAMERTGIADLARRHIDELSGGQRQRVLVAQGLAQDHDLLLLDEPLTGLDLPSARAIDDAIHDEHARGCTVVMTTHDLEEARAADEVLLLAGRVVAYGPPAQVLTTANLAAAYGPSLLHVSGAEIFIDDPAHRPIPGRHVHLERSIHTEPSVADQHGGDG